MKHNEDTRVKIPSILHLTRLGYTYDEMSKDGFLKLLEEIDCYKVTIHAIYHNHQINPKIVTIYDKKNQILSY